MLRGIMCAVGLPSAPANRVEANFSLPSLLAVAMAGCAFKSARATAIERPAIELWRSAKAKAQRGTTALKVGGLAWAEGQGARGKGQGAGVPGTPKVET